MKGTGQGDGRSKSLRITPLPKRYRNVKVPELKIPGLALPPEITGIRNRPLQSASIFAVLG